jgi:hypothetical protein
MSDLEYTLWCIIKGDTIPFKIKAVGSSDIADLKRAVKEETGNLLQNIDAFALILWKVRYFWLFVLTLRVTPS